MARLVLAALLVARVACDCASEYDEFLKNHSSKTRSSERLSIFCSKLAAIEEHNRGNSRFRMGVNKFADWTQEELAMLHGDKSTNTSQGTARFSPLPKFAAKDSIDWRSRMPAVKDQGGCGSCWAFSAIAVVDFFERSHSEQQLLDCSGGSCNGYNSFSALQYMAAGAGSEFEDQYPYETSKGSCRAAAALTAVKNVQQISGASAIMSALQNQVVSVSFELAASSPFDSYKEGVFDKDCGTGDGHAVAVVGYQSDYWIIRNSWGKDWGQDGHIYFQKGIDLCKIETRGPVIADASPSVIMPTDIDAVLTETVGHGAFGGHSYWFKGDQYWKHDSVHDRAEPGYPRAISAGWSSMPADIDAMFSEPANGKYVGHSYWFKGDQYWKYDDVNDVPVSGYPNAISSGWPGMPDNIDAVLVEHSGKFFGYAYFFKGDQYWKWDAVNDVAVSGYPLAISYGWPGMPTNIDAILSEPTNAALKDYVYFFQGAQYWKWDAVNDVAVSGYPLPIDGHWESSTYVSQAHVTFV